FDNREKEFPSIESDTVKITRIIKHTGQGVYKINDVTSTRTQILDVLSLANINPDGYNIILQGDIVRLIEMTPEKRRGIIEEIAGINIYEDKKQKAIRELNRVEEKLNEADIILSERETYLKELKKDRDKAQKYKDLEERRKRNKKTLLTLSMDKKRFLIDKSQKIMDANSEKLTSYEEKISKQQQLIKEKKEVIASINSEIETKGNKDQVQLNKSVENLKVSLALDKQRLETLETELQRVTARKKDLESDQVELVDKTNVLKKRLTEFDKQITQRKKEQSLIDDKISAFKKKHNLEQESSADNRVDEIDKEVESIQQEMNALREKQQNYLREKDKVELQLQSIDDKLEKIAAVASENKKELEQLKSQKQEFKKTSVQLSKALSQSSEQSSQLATARSKTISKQEELAKLQARRSAFLEQVAGGNAIKAIIEKKQSIPGIKGTVAELARVDKKYSQALEIAAGAKIKSIIVDTDTTAAKCISHLKQNRLGVASFLPLNKIRQHTLSSDLKNISGAGIHGFAIDLVDYAKELEPAFKHIFASTLVVDDIQTARHVGVGKVRMVTLTGDIVETSGAMQGGFRQKKVAGAFSQDDVSKKIQALESELSDTQAVISKLELKYDDTVGLIGRLRALKAELEGEIIKKEKSLHMDGDDALLDENKKKELKEKNLELDDQIDDIQELISQKNRTLAQMKGERQQLRDKISDLRNPTKLAELQSYQDKKAALLKEIIELSAERKHVSSELVTVIGPEGKKMLDIIRQHDKEIKNFSEEKNSLEKTIGEKEKTLKESLTKQEKFMAQFKDLFAKKSKLEKEIAVAEGTIASTQSSQRTIELKNNAVHLELARLKAEFSGLEEEAKEFLDVQPYENKSLDVIKRELSQFETMAANLGAVNMRALEIYDSVEKEYASLLEKKDVLRNEREDVLVLMNEIDSKKKELFMKTFEALQANFKRIFSTLLMKGQASIKLEDENDPFNGGVEIKVRLSGKRFLDIRSLSGGEKTMTALAFLFAVQEYEPASFYVLDEVDAALDKKNSKKLAELVRGYCNKAQYVIISHNDAVISEADALYGVSMNEHGASKVTTLKI
ncbi:MAG: hypothetical protein ACOCQQ_00635, partial [Candidatus Nanoarchaeia archaeon]